MTTMTARNTDLDHLAQLLKERSARKVDVVAPAAKIRSEYGVLAVEGAEPIIDVDGVTRADGWFRPGTVALEGISDKLRIPVAYLKRMHADRPDLFDANVNGWLHGLESWQPEAQGQPVPADSRSFLVRAFRSDDGDGFARAFLSDTYRIIDDFDVLMAALDGIRAAGVEANIVGADLTERRMRVRVVSSAVQALAPTLLRGYRSPFTGQSGDDNPVLFAGFEIANSEVGAGAFSITPRMEVQVCANGMTVTKDALRNVHLGSRLDSGVIRWSEETQQRNLELVRSQTVDAVRTFLDVDYMTRTITRLEAKAEEPVETPDMVRDVTKPLGFTDEEVDSLMSFFITSGQPTRGGVANAITAAAQQVDDGDRAAEFEAAAVAVLA